MELQIDSEACSDRQRTALAPRESGPGPRIMARLLLALCNPNAEREDSASNETIFRSINGTGGLRCVVKAHEGLLYPCKRGLYFTPKPLLWIGVEDVDSMGIARGASSTNRYVDLVITCKSGATHSFDMVDREDMDRLSIYVADLKRIMKKSSGGSSATGNTGVTAPANVTPAPAAAVKSEVVATDAQATAAATKAEPMDVSTPAAGTAADTSDESDSDFHGEDEGIRGLTKRSRHFCVRHCSDRIGCPICRIRRLGL